MQSYFEPLLIKSQMIFKHCFDPLYSCVRSFAKLSAGLQNCQMVCKVVLMKLLYSFSVPILTYASEIKEFSYSDMNDCNVALNDAIRRIFSYNRWESIRTLRQQLGYNDLTTIFAIRRRKFYAKIPHMHNETVLALYYCISQ